METRNFGDLFWGRNSFGSDIRKEFFEKWSKMTVEEKIEFMNERIEGSEKDEKRGFFGGRGFGAGFRDHFREKWSGMTQEEKENFIQEREKVMKNGNFVQESFFNREREFSVEAMDKLCEEWLNKTPEEKEEFIKIRKEMFQGRESGIDGFGGFKGFGFGRK